MSSSELRLQARPPGVPEGRCLEVTAAQTHKQQQQHVQQHAGREPLLCGGGAVEGPVRPPVWSSSAMGRRRMQRPPLVQQQVNHQQQQLQQQLQQRVPPEAQQAPGDERERSVPLQEKTEGKISSSAPTSYPLQQGQLALQVQEPQPVVVPLSPQLGGRRLLLPAAELRKRRQQGASSLALPCVPPQQQQQLKQQKRPCSTKSQVDRIKQQQHQHRYEEELLTLLTTVGSACPLKGPEYTPSQWQQQQQHQQWQKLHQGNTGGKLKYAKGGSCPVQQRQTAFEQLLQHRSKRAHVEQLLLCLLRDLYGPNGKTSGKKQEQLHQLLLLQQLLLQQQAHMWDTALLLRAFYEGVHVQQQQQHQQQQQLSEMVKLQQRFELEVQSTLSSIRLRQRDHHELVLQLQQQVEASHVGVLEATAAQQELQKRLQQLHIELGRMSWGSMKNRAELEREQQYQVLQQLTHMRVQIHGDVAAARQVTRALREEAAAMRRMLGQATRRSSSLLRPPPEGQGGALGVQAAAATPRSGIHNPSLFQHIHSWDAPP